MLVPSCFGKNIQRLFLFTDVPSLSKALVSDKNNLFVSWFIVRIISSIQNTVVKMPTKR